MARRAEPARPEGKPGRVIETRGRRVLVRDEDGDRVCFLSGQRVVTGDRVRWVEAPGEGGKITSVDERDTALIRVEFNGREQVLAANLGGLLVVTAPSEPPFRAGLLDRYLVAAAASHLDVIVVLNKVDQGVPDEVAAALALREAVGVEVIRVSATTGEGIAALRARVEDVSADAPWAVVGHSGVGKTSVMAALLPDVDVGAIGAISAYWGTGQHTTTESRLFQVGRGELVDSPGIRTFAPGGLSSEEARLYFPGISQVRCRYRDCLHRPDEDGCVAPDQVPADLLTSYRRLLDELTGIDQRRRPS